MSFLVDTNVISELVRRSPDPGVTAWASTVSQLVISAVTVDEIAYGLAWRPNERVERWFEATLRRQGTVLPVTEAIARLSGQLRGQLAARGEVRTQADMLIAATAQIHRRTLVTRNTRDFSDCGVVLLDPFASGS